MSKWIKIIICVLALIVLSIVIDLICIFTIYKPLFAISNNDGDSTVYKGIFFDTYNCIEYSVPQIKIKGNKFSCAISRKNIGKVVNIKDETKDFEDFACAEALEGFYSDENSAYYYSCMKGKYMVVIYESGYKETIKNALKYGTITISDLDKYGIDYVKYDKED